MRGWAGDVRRLGGDAVMRKNKGHEQRDWGAWGGHLFTFRFLPIPHLTARRGEGKNQGLEQRA